MNDQPTGIVASQKQSFSLAPRDLDEAMRFADFVAKSSIVPKDFQNNPGNVLVAIQWGMELGLQPLQAMQNIAVINNRPSLWGDAVIALVRSSSVCEYIYETDDGNTATCRVKRKGEEEQSRTFSMEDARQAGLLSKQGPWSNYPKRMRQMRARAFAMRDVFPDVLRGMPIAEELQDTAERVVNPTNQEQTKAQKQPDFYPQSDFDANLPKWAKAVAAGKLKAQDIIDKCATRLPLTDDQKKAINDLKEPIEGESITVSFANIADSLNNAKDLDVLYVAADLIDSITDETQRAELHAIFKQREEELSA